MARQLDAHAHAQAEAIHLDRARRELREIFDHIDCPGSVVAYNEAVQRANALADECGSLRQENTELLAENARLRRRLDK